MSTTEHLAFQVLEPVDISLLDAITLRRRGRGGSGEKENDVVEQGGIVLRD